MQELKIVSEHSFTQFTPERVSDEFSNSLQRGRSIRSAQLTRWSAAVEVAVQSGFPKKLQFPVSPTKETGSGVPTNVAQFRGVWDRVIGAKKINNSVKARAAKAAKIFPTFFSFLGVL